MTGNISCETCSKMLDHVPVRPNLSPEVETPPFWKVLALFILALPFTMAHSLQTKTGLPAQHLMKRTVSPPLTLHNATSHPVYETRVSFFPNGEKIALWVTGPNHARSLLGTLLDDQDQPMKDLVASRAAPGDKILSTHSCINVNQSLALAWRTGYYDESSTTNNLHIISDRGTVDSGILGLFEGDTLVENGLSLECTSQGYSVAGVRVTPDGSSLYFRLRNFDLTPRNARDSLVTSNGGEATFTPPQQVVLSNQNMLLIVKRSFIYQKPITHDLVALEVNPTTGLNVGAERNLSPSNCTLFDNFKAFSAGNGNFAITFECNNGVWAQFFKDTGGALGSDFELDPNGSRPRIARAGAGLIITYQTDTEIRDVLMDGDGNVILPPFKVASRVGTQDALPSVAARANHLFHAFQDQGNVFGVNVDLTPMLAKATTVIALPPTTTRPTNPSIAPPVSAQATSGSTDQQKVSTPSSSPHTGTTQQKVSTSSSSPHAGTTQQTSLLSSSVQAQKSPHLSTAPHEATPRQLEIPSPGPKDSPAALIAGIVAAVVTLSTGTSIGAFLYLRKSSKEEKNVPLQVAEKKPQPKPSNQYDSLIKVQDPNSGIYEDVDAPLDGNPLSQYDIVTFDQAGDYVKAPVPANAPPLSESSVADQP